MKVTHEQWTRKGALILSGRDRREVGQMQDGTPGPVGDGLNYQRAALAAAAPEMYRCLQELRAFIAAGSTDDGYRAAVMDESEAVLDAATDVS